jgi:hypothetical protein
MKKMNANEAAWYAGKSAIAILSNDFFLFYQTFV